MSHSKQHFLYDQIASAFIGGSSGGIVLGFQFKNHTTHSHEIDTEDFYTFTAWMDAHTRTHMHTHIYKTDTHTHLKSLM